LSLIILWKNLLPSSCRRSASDRMLHARRSIVNDRKLREKALRRDIDISNTATGRCKVTIHYRSSDGPVLTGFYRHARHGREMCLLNYEFMMATVTASERARERERVLPVRLCKTNAHLADHLPLTVRPTEGLKNSEISKHVHVS